MTIRNENNFRSVKSQQWNLEPRTTALPYNSTKFVSRPY